MHDAVIDELERHFSGNATRAFYAHLDSCPECRVQVAAMDDTAQLLRELRSESEAIIPLGFYNKVSSRIVATETRQAWGLFSPGVQFFRRVAFASLLVLAGLGSYLALQENTFGVAGKPPSANAVRNIDAAAIISQHDPSVSHDAGADRDHMLVTLSNYHE